MTLLPIVLYDIPSTVPGRALSPYVWKVRLALNIKAIPHTTEWVELPHIEELAKSIGADPTALKPDGKSPFYTCPMIRDPNNNDKVVSDSTRIIAYLDEKYPDHTPRLTIKGYETFELVYREALTAKLASFPVLRFSIPATGARLSPESLAHFKKRWEPALGVNDLAELKPNNEENHTKAWNEVEEAFSAVGRWFGEGQVYVMGSQPTIADLDLCGILVWMKRIWGEESREWRDIEGWDDGRWGCIVRSVEELTTIS